MIIGICGKSGCGKSTFSHQIIASCHSEVVHLDIDKVGHNSLTVDKVKEELIKSFGDSIIEENYVDRKKLGEIVFVSRHEMKKLTDITWEYMQLEIDKFLSENNDKIVILDWQLLPKTKYFDMCDMKILLDIPYEIRKKRAMQRDNITEEAFDLRESASIDYNENDFDFVLKESDKEIIKRMVNSL